jgi:hypothetical protein
MSYKVKQVFAVLALLLVIAFAVMSLVMGAA